MEVGDLIVKMQSVKFSDILDKALTELLPEIISMNKDQLWDGKTKLGTDIHPLYSQDPYFKTPQQAAGYASWKSSGSYANPKRNRDAPNLYINGYFYSLIKGTILEDSIEIDADGFGSGFDSKWKFIYGLTKENLNILKPKLLNSILTKYRDAIGYN
jgi:hypothetical protein